MNIKECPCMAFIINSHFPENVGRVVEVKSRAPDMESIPMWNIECKTQLRVMAPINFGGLFVGFVDSHAYTAISPDYALKPIGGVPLNDEQEKELENPKTPEKEPALLS